MPAVAWNLTTARMILGSYAWVERLSTATASREDMGSFRIAAWTDDPKLIPKSKEILVAERLSLYSLAMRMTTYSSRWRP